MAEVASLLDSYRQTTFRVTETDPDIDIRVGRYSDPIDQLLQRYGARTWAFITACNPRSVQLSREENQDRQDALRRELAEAGYVISEGIGVPDESGWEPRRLARIVGISLPEALRVGKKWGQLAILVGERGEAARLEICGTDSESY